MYTTKIGHCYLINYSRKLVRYYCSVLCPIRNTWLFTIVLNLPYQINIFRIYMMTTVGRIKFSHITFWSLKSIKFHYFVSRFFWLITHLYINIDWTMFLLSSLGYIFWTTTTLQPAIHRANFDGSNVTVLVNTDIQYPCMFITLSKLHLTWMIFEVINCWGFFCFHFEQKKSLDRNTL